MGLFNKFSSAKASNTSNNVLESIQNGGDSGCLVWRHSKEDFNTHSVVTVNPGEEAIFIRNGEYIGTLQEGRHELSTNNMYLISSLRNMLSGGETTFRCRIYFVRTAHSEILWGTATPIEFTDYDLELPTRVRGAGTYRITFSNSFLFLKNVVGDKTHFTQNDLSKYFQSQLSQRIYSLIAERLEELSKTEPVYSVTRRLNDFASSLSPQIQNVLSEYGIELTNYSIENLTIDEDEDRKEMMHRNSAAKSKVRELERMGGAYQTIKGMEIMESMANNPNAGGFAGMGAGFGMGAVVGNQMGAMAQNMFSQQPQTQTPSQPDPMETLSKLKKMLDAGLIPQSVYDSKVAEVINNL